MAWARRVGDGHDEVDIRGMFAGQHPSDVLPDIVHLAAVDDGVRAGEVDPLEEAVGGCHLGGGSVRFE